MPSTGLFGPHPLSAEQIAQTVTDAGAGAYALGRMDAKTFIVAYVGRSDVNLPARLQTHAREGKYPTFKYGYLPSSKAAFEKECDLYHDFGESKLLDNEIHPQRPDHSDWECPRCPIFRKLTYPLRRI